MRIVFVESSSRAWGSEQHFINLAKGCQLAGHRVVAVVREASDVARLLKDAGVDVRETPFRGGADPRALLLTWRVLKELDADWLVTDHQKHYWALYVLALMTGTKLAVFRHMAYIRSWFNRVVFPRLSDRFFVVSDYALQALIDAGAPAARLSKLYNPIDLQRFKPDTARAAQTRAALKLPDDAYLVGFIGRHELGKGVEVLRKALSLAMAQDPQLHAVWVGVGPEWRNTQSVIAQDANATRHVFVDWTDRPEDYLVALDTLIAPSQEIETFGRIVAEAQACSVPVIASRVGGMLEAFEPNRSGVVFESGCPVRLAKKILNLKQDPCRRAWMARVGRDFVKQFDTQCVVRLFEQSLRAAVPNRPSRQKQVASPDGGSARFPMKIVALCGFLTVVMASCREIALITI